MNLQPPNNNNGGHSNSSSNYSIPDLPNPNNGESLNSSQPHTFNEDIDSSCSTPYVSAPSSPGRSFNSNNNNGGGGGCFFYSAPASPMHFAISSTKMTNSSSTSCDSSMSSFEFEFSARFVNNESSATNGSMSSADELFLNGQIRPMKLSSHLQRPQMLAPLLDLENEEDEDHHQVEIVRGRDLRQRSKSLRRRTRSLSPLRNPSFQWQEDDQSDDEFDEIRHGCTSTSSKENNNNLGIEEEMEENKDEVLLCDDENRPSDSASSSRSSSVGRSSKRWVFLKEFLYRSKSEGTGRSNTVKFWTSMAFSPAKEKKPTSKSDIPNDSKPEKARNGSNSMDNLKAKLQKNATSKKTSNGKPSNGIGKRRIPPSPHELHYTTNRAQAEEMRKKTYLPYKQGLLGCLGFSSKGYGAINGFARALNPVSSR